MKIGVFDSGKGGAYVAERLRTLLPEHEYIEANDHNHVPYGDREQSEIFALTNAAIQPLLVQCNLIVIACNTATAAAIDELRDRYPQHRFVGYEPMIKPLASLTSHGVLLATQATRESSRYQLLKAAYGNIKIDEPDTTNWAHFIEEGTPERIDLSELDSAIDSGATVISLSCTHYLALQDMLTVRYPQVTIIEPTEAVAKRITALLAH